jgi:hypothetical protein
MPYSTIFLFYSRDTFRVSSFELFNSQVTKSFTYSDQNGNYQEILALIRPPKGHSNLPTFTYSSSQLSGTPSSATALTSDSSSSGFDFSSGSSSCHGQGNETSGLLTTSGVGAAGFFALRFFRFWTSFRLVSCFVVRTIVPPVVLGGLSSVRGLGAPIRRVFAFSHDCGCFSVRNE